MPSSNNQLVTEMKDELKNILHFWKDHTIDQEKGGFYGRLLQDNKVDPYALKGSVLNARILWTFAAAAQVTGDPTDILIADKAYQYISDHFVDKEFGGVYWTVDYAGNPVDSKKQVYAIAFTIYALSEYYKIKQEEDILQMAQQLYQDLERHAFDPVQKGYFEAFSREWHELKDQRLSLKDANEKKSMNTHLHVLEAYTNLYRVWPDQGVKNQIIDLLRVFDEYILDESKTHLQLFFSEDWSVKGNTVSFGHDIEAAWLMQEAAEVIEDPYYTGLFKAIALKIADSTNSGFDADGGLWYEFDIDKNHLVKEKHWWPQAEAVVGYVNAWQTSGQPGYLEQALKTWNFIQRYIIDHNNGEWFWGLDANYKIMPEDKVGIWKCPYHNGRACIEIIKRLDK